MDLTSIWNWLLGLKSTSTGEAVSRHVEFRSLPSGIGSVAVIALVALAIFGIWYLYKREGRNLTLGTRLFLGGLRLAILAGVLMMLLEMVVVTTHRETVPTNLLVLADTSQSMDLKDQYANESQAAATARALGILGENGVPDLALLRKTPRLELASKAFDKVKEPLSQGRVLHLYSFNSQLTSLMPDGLTDKISADGPLTGIGTALSSSLAAHKGQPLSGVLLLTDGRSNVGEDPQIVAQQAAALGIPIVSLAVGTEELPRNAHLADLVVSPVVFLRDPTDINVMVESTGLKDSPVSVILEQRQGEGDWTEVGRQVVTLGDASVRQSVPFQFAAENVGQLDFRARVADVGPEFDESDNATTKSIKVIRQRIRVLMICGYPANEVQFLRNALNRDAGIEFASWLQTAGEGYEQQGSRPLRRLPATQEELNHYDVLLLFDPDMNKLGSNWSEMITKFVGEAGGGLIYIAGELHSQEAFSAEASAEGGPYSWVRILPVMRDRTLYQSSADVRLSSQKTYLFELTPEGSTDPIFQFVADGEKNRNVITSLPGMYWHFPVTRAKQGATVLVRHGDPRMRNNFGRHVLMAMQWYGPGRSVFMGFDSTFRWRYLDEDYFDGFWARIMDRVGRSKALGGRYPFTLATDKSVYRVGDRVKVRAEFIAGASDMTSVGDLRGEIDFGGDAPMPLALESASDGSGILEGNFIATQAGAYSLRVLPAAITDAEQLIRPATLSFRVEPSRKELDQPTLNLALLESLAKSTQGKVVSLANVDSLPEAFKVHEQELTHEDPEEVWDAPLLYGGIFLMLVVEWVGRKLQRMA